MRNVITALVFAIFAPSTAAQAPVLTAPQHVSVQGYDGDIMEPFLSRDGHTLFFNNRNSPPKLTDLHWAERIDDLNFRYRGKLAAANSDMLDGVPSLSASGRLCFISTRSYGSSLATIHCGDWTGADLENLSLQRQAAPLIPGRVVFDVELAASGDFAVIADGRFTGGPMPVAANLRLARGADELVLDPASDTLFTNINTDALEYAAGLSSNGLTLCFTRFDKGLPALWIAQRRALLAPFGPPSPIPGITGFVEACTFAPDGAIYFHRLDGLHFGLWRKTLD